MNPPATDLDRDTADRLLAGSISADDAPPGYEAVADLLATARGFPDAGGLDREAEAVAAFRAAGRRDRPGRARRLTRRLAVPGVATALLLAGAGAAAAGALPAPVQQVAHDAMAQLGIAVPAAPAHPARPAATGSPTGATTHRGSTPPCAADRSGCGAPTSASPATPSNGVPRSAPPTSVTSAATTSGSNPPAATSPSKGKPNPSPGVAVGKGGESPGSGRAVGSNGDPGSKRGTSSKSGDVSHSTNSATNTKSS